MVGPREKYRAGPNLFDARREAKLVTRGASDRQLEFAVNEFGVAYQTAHKPDAGDFRQTGAHWQAEIVALFACLQGARPHTGLGPQA